MTSSEEPESPEFIECNNDDVVIIYSYIGEPRMYTHNYHLVLDIDGTLIDHRKWNVGDEFTQLFIDDCNIYFRPYLEEFMEWAFRTFKTVGVYTASQERWAHPILNYILPFGHEFNFIWTFQDCEVVYNNRMNWFTGEDEVVSNLIKPLDKLYDSEIGIRRNMNRYNTLILDDTPQTFEENKENGVEITSYNSLYEGDTALVWMKNVIMERFERLVGRKEKMD